MKERILPGFVMLGLTSLLVACTAGPGNSRDAGTAGLTKTAGLKLARADARPTPPQEPVGLQKGGILLVYPKEGAQIYAPSTFVLGSVPAGSTLTINGNPARLSPQGYFAQTVPIQFGKNTLTLVRDGDQANAISISVNRPSPSKPLPALPLQIVAKSIEPADDIVAAPGDIIQFGVRATPGSAVKAQVGNRAIALTPAKAGKRGGVNMGLDTTFGVTFQGGPSSLPDYYTGFYKVRPDDNWRELQPKIFASKAGQNVSSVSPARLSVLHQPFVGATLHDDTVVRVGPGQARTTPWVEGVRVLVDGGRGDSWRAEMAPGKHLWIQKADLASDVDVNTPPLATVRTLNIETEGNGGARIVVPLNQRLPYQVDQSTKPNKLTLKVYGATADTDWITPPQTTNIPRTPIANVTWAQPLDRLYQVTVNLTPAQQWGYWVDYEGTNLVLHIKGAPNMVAPGQTLAGLVICVDPGHGGMETGSIGLSGIKEATVNMAIARYVKQLLINEGATVIMTREEDVDVPLGERVKIAERNLADLLVSIHNNALPDGRDPWKEHGTSSYWYHQQSHPLAKVMKDGVVAQLGFPDYGSRFQNLALARPSRLLASLVEVGFMINPDEYAQLIQPAGQQKAAVGIVQGIKTFLASALAQRPAIEQPSGQ